jgi:hypothetical protein
MIQKFFEWKQHEFVTIGLLGLIGGLATLVDGAIGGLAVILAIAYIVFKKKLVK